MNFGQGLEPINDPRVFFEMELKNYVAGAESAKWLPTLPFTHTYPWVKVATNTFQTKLVSSLVQIFLQTLLFLTLTHIINLKGTFGRIYNTVFAIRYSPLFFLIHWSLLWCRHDVLKAFAWNFHIFMFFCRLSGKQCLMHTMPIECDAMFCNLNTSPTRLSLKLVAR